MTLDPVTVAAPSPPDEAERLADLYGYSILDTDPEEEFDALAHLAATICGAPMARINFVDRHRQWTKAVFGMERDETPREAAFCPHTIVAPGGFMIVEDAQLDPRFARNPLVLTDPNIRFYAGAAIRSPGGRALGSVCVLDTEPRGLDAAQRAALAELSRLATTQLELRRLLTRERLLTDDLRELDRQKAAFTSSVAHDFRTPLTSIKGYAELLREDAVTADVALDAIERGSERLLDLVDDLSGARTGAETEAFDLAALTRAAIELLQPAAAAGGVELRADLAEAATVRGDRNRLAQVVENLVGNAIKYAPGGTVSVCVSPTAAGVHLDVSDTGIGIPLDEHERIFERFFRASTAASFPGTGVGLATVTTIVEAHGGSIEIARLVGEGTTFSVRLPAP